MTGPRPRAATGLITAPGHSARLALALAVLALPAAPALGAPRSPVAWAAQAAAVPGDAPAAGLAATDPAPALAPRHDPDLALALVAGGAFALAASHDLEITRQVREAAPSRAADDAARAFRQLGEPVVVGGALAATWAWARLGHAPAVERAAVRAGFGVAVPGLACLALKEAFGRARPRASPDDAWRLRPFHGDASLPSGHTTVAFAAATVLDRETGARWVPWVAYPAAAMTGWSRVHDLEHWTSDVVAGAALGYWGARITDDALRRRDAGVGRTSVILAPDRGGITVALARGF